MTWHWSKTPSHRYSALQDEDKDGSVDGKNTKATGRWHVSPLSLVLMVVVGISSYLLGASRHAQHDHGLLSTAGAIEHEFVYNRNFSMAPTNETSGMWRALFPKNGGFIHHPVLAANFSGIAVFHQLHCLHALYNLHYGVMGHSHSNATESKGSHNLDPAVHARHCFDYLRQSLMCQADTNLEDYNYRLDGSTGWGPKRCRDYQSVVDFANKWGGSKYADGHGQV